MSKYNRIALEWENFERKVVFKDTPENVRLSMRMAFYGGVSVLQRLMKDVSGHDEPTDEDIDKMEDVILELREFSMLMHMVAEGIASGQAS